MIKIGKKGNLSVTFSGSSHIKNNKSIIEKMGIQDLEIEDWKNNCIILRKMLNKFEKLV